MNTQPPPTSTQPQVNDSRIYSSKALPTIRVRLKDSGREQDINEKDFDDGRHVRVK